MMPIQPFWFKLRQCKAEPVGDNALKVSGPNMGEAFLVVARDGDRWKASLRQSLDGPDVQSATDLPNERAAWDAAFELFRLAVVV